MQNYDQLEGAYVFTPANLGKHRRRQRLKRLLSPDYAPAPIAARPRRGSTADAVFACDFYQTKNGARAHSPRCGITRRMKFKRRSLDRGAPFQLAGVQGLEP